MKSTKRNTALGKIYWGTRFDGRPLTDPWLRLEVDQRYFETRPRSWYVARLGDGRVYLRSPRDRTEALIVDYNQRLLNRVELTLLGIPSVSSVRWVGENRVSVVIKSGPVSDPTALLRSLGRRISKSLHSAPHQTAGPLEDDYHGKLWIFGSGCYYCQPDRGFVGPDGYTVSIACYNGSTEKGIWSYGGIRQMHVNDTANLVGYRVTEDEMASAKLVPYFSILSTGFSAEWEPVDEEGLRRICHVWRAVSERAQGDTHYWWNDATRRTYGYSEKVLKVLADADRFLLKHLPTS